MFTKTMEASVWRALAVGAAALAVLASAGTARANWLNAYGTPENNALMPIQSTVTGVGGGSAITMGNEDLFVGAPIAVLNNSLFAVAMRSEEFGSTETKRLWIKSFNKNTGVVEWESPFLEGTVSVGDGSAAGMAVDATSSSIYYGCGQTMYRLSAVTGAIVWETTITAGNTGAGRSYDIVNSSPALGSGRVFVQTRDYSGANSQLVAFDVATGAIDWSAPVGGIGVNKPIYSDNGTSQVVYAMAGTTVSGTMVCHDAATGAEVWNSATAPVPWSLPAGFHFWGEALLDGGRVYAQGYDFSSSAPLVCVDASNGNMDWQIIAEGSDTAPLLVGGNLLVRGGDFFAFETYVTGYSPATGAVTIPTAVFSGITFRNAMAATNDRVYLGNGSSLLVLDSATLALLSQSPASFIDGPVALDAAGNVFVHDYQSFGTDVKRLARFSGVARVADWTVY